MFLNGSGMLSEKAPEKQTPGAGQAVETTFSHLENGVELTRRSAKKEGGAKTAKSSWDF